MLDREVLNRALEILRDGSTRHPGVGVLLNHAQCGAILEYIEELEQARVLTRGSWSMPGGNYRTTEVQNDNHNE